MLEKQKEGCEMKHGVETKWVDWQIVEKRREQAIHGKLPAI
jgi:hypothetical protein